MKKALIIAISAAAVIACVIGCQGMFGPKEIKIGAILPLSGDAALYGVSPQKGMNVALDEINKYGGIKGKKLIIQYEDSKALPNDGVAACNKLITIDKVKAIIGDAASSVTLAIAPIVEKNKVVLLSPLSSAPAITNAGDYIFRIVPSDLFGGKIAAYFAVKDQLWEKVAILYINNDFGVGLKDVFKNELEALGGAVVIAESADQGSTDFRTQLFKIKKSKPEAIFVIGYRETPKILIQMREIGLKIPVLGTGDMEDPNLIKIARKAAEGIFFTQLKYDITDSTSSLVEFVNRYKMKYNTEPDIFAAYGYDAMRLLAYAIGQSDFTGEGIKNALYQVKSFKGVTGEISFDANGDVIQTMGVKTVKNGKFIWYKKEINLN